MTRHPLDPSPAPAVSDRKLRTLVEALNALIAHPRFEDSFHEFVRSLKQRLGIEKTGLLRFNPGRGAFELYPGIHSDFDEAETRRIFQRVTKNAETFLAGGGEGPLTGGAPPRDPMIPTWIFRYREGGVEKSLYLLPLRLRGEFAGVFLLSKPYLGEDVYFDDQVFLAAIGDQVATFLERARLFQQIEADRHRMEFLYTLSRDVSLALEPGEIVKTTAARILANFPFALCAFLTYDESDGFHLFIRSRNQLPVKREMEILRDLKENLAGFLEPAMAGRLSACRKETAVEELVPAARGDASASWSCLLSYNNALTGIFAVYGRADKGRLVSGETQKILSTACLQVAASLQNADLFKKTRLLSITDPVTRLYNHRYFLQALENEVGRFDRYGAKLAIAMADIDHFKRFNDTYGHKTGDEVLFRVAETIKRAAREIDVVARYGGEEFVIVMPATELEGAVQLAERVRRMISSLPLRAGEKTLAVSISLGVAQMEPGTTITQLIERADEALYAAKNGGRNAVFFRDRSGGLARVRPSRETGKHDRKPSGRKTGR